jgi:nitrile hydratase accessory protein
MSEQNMDEALAQMPIPKDEGGPIFEEPWQAQAFAMTVQMHEAGHFKWTEWADIFGAEIAAATKAGRGCGNGDYYACWLTALEKLMAQKQFVSQPERAQRHEEWLQAHLHTPHGEPVELKKSQ